MTLVMTMHHSATEYLYHVVLGLIASSLSFAASVCLLYWLKGVKEVNRQKLMWRQLWHISVADLVFGLFAIPELLIMLLSRNDVLSAGPNQKILENSCVVVALAYSVGLNTSAIFETHLAMSFTAAIFRWPRVLNCLRSTLILIWPLGCVVSLVETYLEQYSWRAGMGCVCTTSDITFTIVYGSCSFVALTSYVFCLAKMCIASHTVNHAVVHRVWNRVSFYILASLVCNLPSAIRVSSDFNIFQTKPAMTQLADVLLCCNGFANAVVYALQSRYVRRVSVWHSRIGATPANRSNRESGGGSYHVGLGNVEEILPSLLQSSQKSVSGGGSGGSLRDSAADTVDTDTAIWQDEINRDLGTSERSTGSQSHGRYTDTDTDATRTLTTTLTDTDATRTLVSSERSMEDLLLGCFDDHEDLRSKPPEQEQPPSV